MHYFIASTFLFSFVNLHALLFKKHFIYCLHFRSEYLDQYVYLCILEDF